MNTSQKIARIVELCERAGWRDMADHELTMRQASRSWNRGAVRDALLDYLEGQDVKTERTAEVVRVSFCDPKHPRIRLHVETWDGKIRSASYDYFDEQVASSLTGIIREIEHEAWMADIRKSKVSA